MAARRCALWTELVTPEAEHVLDWFHVTVRLTVLSQNARGVAHHDKPEGARLLAALDSIKWLLWHGNQYRAGEEIAFLEDDVDGLAMDYPHLNKFGRAAHEFAVYITSNAASLINYGERFRSGERISSCLGREHGQRCDQQALRQAPTDAVDQARRPSAAANPNADARWYAPVTVRALVSGARQRQWKRRCSSRRGMSTPDILMVSRRPRTNADLPHEDQLRITPRRVGGIPLTIHQFSRQSQSFGSGKARSISLTAVRSPRVNQESLLLASFLG